MADVNVSAMADQTQITVVIVRLRTTGLTEGSTGTSFQSEGVIRKNE
ncbi:MAG TPA: hypothetical protein VN239_05250 [Nitrososphaera sp.]|jgi:hypothetical protein|nr:hypothetical protein [Nitrososphaera sp.]